jgi:two-component system nitrogen regulation response regulator NtrX
MAHILIVDDEIGIRTTFAEFLEDCGHTTLTAEDGEAAKRILLTESAKKKNSSFDIILCDMVMPHCGGAALFQWMQNTGFAHIPFVCISGRSDSQDVMAITKNGAFDFISKPLGDLRELQSVVERAVTSTIPHHGLISLTESSEPTSQASALSSLVGRSPKFLKVAQMIARVAATDTTVLITGESGTGKEVVARAIHNSSNRKNEPFVAVNCAAIPSTLIESELFGYEKGAFTGATQSKSGRFTQANKGTIFLDEIGELDIALQSKLLRVIQERAVEPVGSTKLVNINVRILSATNRDLDQMVTEGKFRNDLLFRLRVYPISLPALRERKGDILPLIRHLSSKIAAKMNIVPPALTKDAFQKLLAYSWPGNIRELENTIERALIERANGGVILPQDIHVSELSHTITTADVLSTHTQMPATIGTPLSSNRETAASTDGDFVLKISQSNLSWNSIEQQVLTHILELSNNNVSQAAKLLDINRSHLRSRLRFHRLGK